VSLFFFALVPTLAGNTYNYPGNAVCKSCNVGYFARLSGQCEVCPSGTDCYEPGKSTQTMLRIKEGFWRMTANSFVIRECLMGPVACLGDNSSQLASELLGFVIDEGLVNFTNTSVPWVARGRRRLESGIGRRRLAARGDVYGDAYCAKGYMGPMCGVCDPDGYYLDTSGQSPVRFSNSFRMKHQKSFIVELLLVCVQSSMTPSDLFRCLYLQFLIECTCVLYIFFMIYVCRCAPSAMTGKT